MTGSHKIFGTETDSHVQLPQYFVHVPPAINDPQNKNYVFSVVRQIVHNVIVNDFFS